MIWAAGCAGCHPNGILWKNVRPLECLVLKSGLQEADPGEFPES
jgi:hypothetical protein